MLGQIVLGGLTVLFELRPGFVMAHFLLSMVILADAVVLHDRAGRPDDARPTRSRSVADGDVRRLGSLAVVAAGLVLFLGTVVTSSGPHGGDENAERLQFALPDVARFHGASVILFLALTLVTLWRLRSAAAGTGRHRAPPGRGGAGGVGRPGRPRLHPVLQRRARPPGRLPRRRRGRGVGRHPPLPPRLRRRSTQGTAAGTRLSTLAGMSPSLSVAPVEVKEPEIEEVVTPDTPWVVIVWNDPINLMSYVTFVLQKLFGYSLDKATKLMLDVHHKGKAVVSNGTREKAELDVFRLHEHGLWATMQHDE